MGVIQSFCNWLSFLFQNDNIMIPCCRDDVIVPHYITRTHTVHLISVSLQTYHNIANLITEFIHSIHYYRYYDHYYYWQYDKISDERHVSLNCIEIIRGTNFSRSIIALSEIYITHVRYDRIFIYVVTPDNYKNITRFWEPRGSDTIDIPLVLRYDKGERKLGTIRIL